MFYIYVSGTFEIVVNYRIKRGEQVFIEYGFEKGWGGFPKWWILE